MTDTIVCQYCGATIAADSETCIMCGSPTKPPPPPTYIPTETPPSPEIMEPLPSEPPASEYKPPQPDFTTPRPAAAPSNRTTAVIIEIAAGIFFFLGIGWMIAGKLGLGISLLVGYWIFIAIYAVILTALSPFTMGLSFLGICLLPIVPVISGYILNTQLQ